MIKKGMLVELFYDPRPLFNMSKYKAEIIRVTKTGFRIKNLDNPGLYEGVFFCKNGTVRGWNTLTWEPLRQSPGEAQQC